MPSPIAVTRAISPRLAACELSFRQREPIDLALASRQHAAYESVLAALGCEVLRAPPAPELPDSVFVEDTALVLDEVAVAARPGAPSRRSEVDAVAALLARWRPVVRLAGPGTLDGGDVLVAGRTIFVGCTARSDDAGRAALAAIVAPWGYRVVAVPVAGCLHLKSAATLVADDLLLVAPERVDAVHFSPLRHLAIDPAEPDAANALLVAGAAIVPAEHPRTAERLKAAGVEVLPVPAGELAKAEGGVTCCCLLVSR